MILLLPKAFNRDTPSAREKTALRPPHRRAGSGGKRSGMRNMRLSSTKDTSLKRHSQTEMSYGALRAKLVDMPKTGESGFEGLVAALLSALTGDRYYIARSGDQPADAVSQPGAVAIQGKRYDQTNIDETEFEGDFHKACRMFPRLDCYVFAATRTTAQLSVLATQLQNQTGVDILLVGFGDADSALEALCVTYWDVAKTFPKLSELDASLANWAAGEAEKSELQAAVKRLRNTITDSMAVATSVHEKLHERLMERFGLSPSSARPSRFLIDLVNAVPRQSAEKALSEWWLEKKARTAAVIGEEGLGKSWIAARFAFNASESKVLVFWLDSADWSGAKSLEDVISEGLLQAGIEDPSLRDRISRKALVRWRETLLIVLDGVNEHAAQSTAQRLLSHLHASKTAPCRLLFTTRPRLWPSDERALWDLTTQIAASPFTDSELAEALSRLPSRVGPSELPAGLVEVARIPRYFQRATELRAHFKTLAVVTKPMVLWAELLQKVNAGDRQLTEKLRWSSPADVRRGLVKLATAAGAMKIAQGDAYDLLDASFGHRFEEIRNDLADQRIVLAPTGDQPSISPEHVILGFAIHLAGFVQLHDSDPVGGLADRLRRELEPVLAQDQLTEALFVGLQLSAFPEPQGVRISSKARAALLIAWTSSQNSRVNPERLVFWCAHDPLAYLDFVEEIFTEPVSDRWADLISMPLRSAWKESPTDLMASRMREWMLLVWRSYDCYAEKEIIVDGARLRVGRTSSQLRLSFVGIAVLSERPEESFLPILAVAWGTDFKSVRRHFFQHPSAPEEKYQDIGCKDIDNNIGALLRWRYTETVASKIEALRCETAPDSATHKGYAAMLRAFHEFGGMRIHPPEEELRLGRRMFDGAPDAYRLVLEECTELAVRDDFPDLAKQDQQILLAIMERVFRSEELESGYWRTRADLNAEMYLPWFAKYHPNYLIRFASEFRIRALKQKPPGPGLSLANDLPCSAELSPPGELLALAKQAAESERTETQARSDWTFALLHVLALTRLDEEQLLEWLQFASENKALRREIHIWQVVQLSPVLITDRIAKFARERAKEFCDDPPPSDRSDERFDFWASIGGTAGPPDEAYHEWVTDQMRRLKPAGDRRFYWLYLWFRSATGEQLADALADGTLVDHLTERGLRAMYFAGRDINEWAHLPQLDLPNLCRAIALDHVGILLLRAGRIEHLDEWGNALFTRAMELVGAPPFERRFWGDTRIIVNSTGRKLGATCENSADLETDLLRPEDPPRLGNDLSGEELEGQANQGIKIWRQDQKLLDQIDQCGFHDFEGVEPLAAFRDRNPDRFRVLATELLHRATAEPEKAFHLGGFIVSVVAAVAPLDSELALTTDRLLVRSRLRLSVTNGYNVSIVIAAFWRAAGSGHEACKRICRSLIQNAGTDEELMWHAITAQAEGATEELTKVCRELRQCVCAKQRCLAISLLAWIPTAGSDIDSFAENDPSGWVVQHARWAKEVVRQEIAARRYYEATLRERDNNRLLCRLRVLEPALTPTALVWADAIGSAATELEPRNRAALFLFWDGLGKKLEKAPNLYGRNVKEYLRGEPLNDLRSPKPTLIG